MSKYKAKAPHLENNLVIIKYPKRRVCVYKKRNKVYLNKIGLSKEP